nr:hypothetical protein CFP56_16575 [Quercus suber]
MPRPDVSAPSCRKRRSSFLLLVVCGLIPPILQSKHVQRSRQLSPRPSTRRDFVRCHLAHGWLAAVSMYEELSCVCAECATITILITCGPDDSLHGSLIGARSTFPMIASNLPTSHSPSLASLHKSPRIGSHQTSAEETAADGSCERNGNSSSGYLALMISQYLLSGLVDVGLEVCCKTVWSVTLCWGAAAVMLWSLALVGK